MAQTFEVNLGYDIASSVDVSGMVETEPPGLSGLYVRLFAPVDTQTGNPMLVEVMPLAVPLRVERRYELPSGSALRIEVDATAGSSGAGVSVSAHTPDGRSATATGFTNETLVLTLA